MPSELKVGDRWSTEAKSESGLTWGATIEVIRLWFWWAQIKVCVWPLGTQTNWVLRRTAQKSKSDSTPPEGSAADGR